MLRVEIHLVILNANAVAGRGLASNCQIGVDDLEFGLERDCTRDAKNDGSRPFRPARSAETARAVVVEIGHLDHPTTAAADGVLAKPFRAGERRRSSGKQV